MRKYLQRSLCVENAGKAAEQSWLGKAEFEQVMDLAVSVFFSQKNLYCFENGISLNLR